MTDSADDVSIGSEDRVISAMVLPSFNAPGSILPPTEAERVAVKTSGDWQVLGAQATTWEIHGTLAGVEHGRLAELFGLAGAAGEQLGLAATASRDIARWLAVTEDVNDGWGFATRAATERLVSYLHSASHHFGSVATRTMLLRPPASSPLVRKQARYARDYPDRPALWTPFSSDPAAFFPLNRETARMVRREARCHDAECFTHVADAVSSVTSDDRWEEMVGRRHNEYHRWRVQSSPGADPAEFPWKREADTLTLSVRVQRAVPFDPMRTVQLAEDARAGLHLLATAMRTWLRVWEEHWEKFLAG